MKDKTNAMSSEEPCPQCGANVPAGAPEGLCPGCLLKQGTASGPHSAPFEPPSLAELAALFPQLEIIALIGKGGMGAVYKARQRALDRLIALKILPRQTEAGTRFTERFNREARALARLTHPNIVSMHEFGEAGGLFYFIMEFVDGVNLRQLQQTRKLSAREALQIIAQVCDALQYAHDEGIVHRDIKPENVLIDRKGHVKIADFGLAKILDTEAGDPHLTVDGQVMGTPHYMAPEQLERPQEVDHRADIFSLGVVFYELLTGELPLGKFAPPSRKVHVDIRLDEIVLRALEKEPEQRYQHASEMKTQVNTISDPAKRVSATPIRRLLGGLIAVILLSTIIIVALFGWRHMPHENSTPPARALKTTPETDAVARRKIQFLEQQMREIENKRNVGAATSFDYEKAKAARDIAIAELQGDAVEAARLKLNMAELELTVAQKKFEVGRATGLEVEKAKLDRDVAKIEYEEEQKKLKH